MNNHIYIIGSGAIGKTLAVFLKLQNRDVTLIRGSIDDGSSHAEHIQVVVDNSTELTADIQVSTLSNFHELDGIVVLANKSYGNEDLSRSLKDKINSSPVVIMQNGLGVERPFAGNDFPGVYRCVLFATCQAISGNRLRFKPVSDSPIGVIKGDHDSLHAIVEQLNNPIFPFKAEANIQPVIWKKAITNCVFNSVCPLLNIDNGVFHREEKALEMAKRIIDECIVIAKEEGIFLDAGEVVNRLLLISKSSDGQLISTLQDINNGKKTEIETLNFEIARIAKSLNKEDLVKETRLLGELTKLKSDLHRARQEH